MQDQGDWADRGRIQDSLRDGNKETVTLMLLLSAGGAPIPPCVILRDQKLNSIWSELENNPLQCPYVLTTTDFQQDADV